MPKFALVLLASVALACASSGPSSAGSTGGGKVLEPAVQLFQISGPSDQQYPTGDMEIQFGMRITNRSSEEILLRRVQVESLGEGGPYQLRRATYNFGKSLPANQSTDVTFWAKAIGGGNPFALDAQAPVTVRGTAYFESQGRMFRTVFVKNFSQSTSMGR